MIRLVALALLPLAACAALSDVSPIGNGAYLTAAHSNDVNARVDEQKAKVQARAAQFCAQRGARVEVIRLVDASPPPGQPPAAQLEFRCAP